MKRLRLHKIALTLVMFSSAVIAFAAIDTRLGSDATEDDIASALAGPVNVSKAFRRTNLPDPSSNRCQTQSRASSNKNLEVVDVPYVDDNSVQHVDMNIQFETGSDRVSADGKRLLSKAASALNSDQLINFKFAVAGHTDNTGDAKINLELSCARAIAVKNYLVQRGVEPSRLSTYGFGSTRPLDGSGASATNRRVEVRRGS